MYKCVSLGRKIGNSLFDQVNRILTRNVVNFNDFSILRDLWRFGGIKVGASSDLTRCVSFRSMTTGSEESREKPVLSKTLTKQELKNFQGNYQRYRRNFGLPEFHNVDLDRNGLIIEPTDRFMLVLTTSKNNVHAQLVNRSKNYRTVFGSFAGNVGYRKKMQQTDKCAYRIGENIARKCKRLGIFAVDVKFRRIARVENVLQAFHAIGLQVSQLIHEPRLPKTGVNSVRPRRRRRV
ncbi:Ribosomal protein S11 family protein [Theileria parva strain Muguga]|uniref:40S ribosomal protein S11, putative n=1 Tax=Theileria parva TaxID=5875 RepID=Q4N9D4_THEPA|nr:Ribosomal protein S11 family protein [Theileria parva strain Muguga]EAN33424.1 Ribosomal protein S11 family protein [Theileria parva strain Muguga]|eukprot:XP_765707.1 40S ribosomal protein S11 [Theileria parva strain Muguga]